MSPAGRIHGRTAARFLARLAAFVDAHRLGECYAAETGFVLGRDPDTVRAPDVAFVSRARASAVERSPEAYFPGPPDLAVEVVSPGDSYSEVEEKVGAWLAAGTVAVIVVDPKRERAVLHRSGNDVRQFQRADVLALEDLLPGWALPLADLFA